MCDIVLKHKEKCRILNSGDAQGRAVIYKDIIDELANDEKKYDDFIRQLHEIVDEEMHIARNIQSSVNYFKTNDRVLMNSVDVLHKSIFLKQFKNLVLEKKCDVRIAFIEAYNRNVEDVLNQVYRENSKQEVIETINYSKKRIVSLINKVLIKDLIRNIDEDFIFVTHDFQTEIFDGISRHLKGVICVNKKVNRIASAYATDFGFPLATCSEVITRNDYIIMDHKNKSIILNPSSERRAEQQIMIESKHDDKLPLFNFKDSKVKIFASSVDTRSIDVIAQSNNYHGLCTFRTEYFYSARGITPSLEEQIKIYTNIITQMGKKEVFIEIPHFDHNIKLDIMGEECTDCRGLDKFSSIFEVFFDAVAIASFRTKKEISIVIPMLITATEIAEWIMHIEYHFDNAKAPRPNIGGILESEAAVMHGQDFTRLDFVIIGLDDLYDEIDEDYDKLLGNAHLEMIDAVSLDDLRRIHRLLQHRHVNQRHILHGDVLTNPQILHKLLKRGFKEFAIPVNKMHLVHDVFVKHLESVGKFRGYRARQIQKKLNKLMNKLSENDSK